VKLLQNGSVVPLYVYTTKEEKSCIWHEIEVIPSRI